MAEGFLTEEPEIVEGALKQIRTAIGATQTQMAQQMGMPLRTYQDLEAGLAKVRGVHMWAAQMATMRHYAANTEGEGFLPPGLLLLAKRVVAKYEKYHPDEA